jgi:hypothetical protein
MPQIKKGDKTYIIYDGRYHTDPESAQVMSVCSTQDEAMHEKSDYGTDTVVVECQCKDGKTMEETGKTWN